MVALNRKPAILLETPRPPGRPRRLTGGQTSQDNARSYRDLAARLAMLRTPCFWPALPGKPALSALERTGLVRLVDGIPGPCGEETMLAMIEAMRHAPPGDVVEIGCGWGRSAALLVWLARRYKIGKLLCVDPWTDCAGQDVDADAALRIFEINLAPLAGRELNYLRARSEAAAKLYAPGLAVRTEAFGETTYEGRIAFLHIAGARAEPDAARDGALWTPQVVPGGWICFDGNDGALDDGPGPVAGAFLERNQGRISTRFQAGPALFVQLKR